MKQLFSGAVMLLICCACMQAQNMKRVKKVVEELSSPAYYGRGYTNKGDSLAADYIAHQLKKTGVKPIGSSYFQRFNMSINNYIGNPSLEIGQRQLVNGMDWVAYPTSPTIQGSFPLIWITNDMLTNKSQLKSLLAEDLKNSFICFDSTVINNAELYYFARNLFTTLPFMVRGVIDRVETPKYSARRYVNEYGTIRVKKDFVTPDDKFIDIDLVSDFNTDYQTQNVSGLIKGKTDTCIALIGHYDHMGMFGEAMYGGANDNASGVGMMLELADYFMKKQPHYSIQFIFFAAEEASFYGSEYYVANPVYPLDKTKLVINFDMVATGTQWTELIHANLYPDIKRQLMTINNSKSYIDHLKPTGYEDTSDHYHFHDAGIRALFFWTAGGNDNYHEPSDTADKLEYPVFEGIYQLVIDFIEEYH
ncbi:M28 family metallopeptidase [Carboxylicivirga sp. RSCT41]|uniref:M28 family metallopeptidase n=1 Tax=Carboxylicivirga agarovorans TaxID=3417570 RepID=UPI003D34AAD0